MMAGSGARVGGTGGSEAASSGQPWPGVATMVTATVVERFVRWPPVPPVLPTAVWINEPRAGLVTGNAQKNVKSPVSQRY